MHLVSSQNKFGINEYFNFMPIILVNIFFVNITFEEITNQLIFFVIALTRLLPSFNRTFSSYNFINYSEAVINKIYNLIEEDDSENKPLINKSENILFNNQISLNKISYAYPNSTKYILNNVDFSLKNKSIFAIAGKSGSGKTTLINLMMGLLIPSKGEIFMITTH